MLVNNDRDLAIVGASMLAIKMRWESVVIFTAWLLFIASLFLPATSDGTLGLGAAINAIYLVLTPIGWVMTVADPRLVVYWYSPVVNVTMLLAPWIIHRNVEHIHRIIMLLLPGLFTPILFLVFIDLRASVGFYLWISSIVLMMFGGWKLERYYAQYSDRL